VSGKTGDGSLGETPSGVDNKNEVDGEVTAELESEVLRWASVLNWELSSERERSEDQ
jgi:hypothetical protein